MTELMCPGHFEAENTHIQQVLMKHTDEGVLGTTDFLDSEKKCFLFTGRLNASGEKHKIIL